MTAPRRVSAFLCTEGEVGMANSPRRLVLCLDGTWQNTYRAKQRDDGSKVLKPSNVLKLSRAVLPRDPADGRTQITFYDTGVGAQVKYPGLANKILRFCDSKLGGAWGAGFETNVEEAFRFLVHNYREGDQVFLFGFSRGASQVRALTGFLDWLGGIPTKGDAYFGPLYFHTYVTSRGKADPDSVVTSSGHGPSEDLVKVRIDFLGVWDTVLALGTRFGKQVGTSSPKYAYLLGKAPAKCVRHARQALAIDEARDDFRPEIWREARNGQTLEQRWFAGCHANVGGGNLKDGLANGPLCWLLEEAKAQGLAIDGDFLGFYDSYPQARLYDSRSLLYVILDWIRRRPRGGRRVLTGHPPEARLDLDASVLKRMVADHTRHKQMSETYAPENLVAFLADQPDVDAYFRGKGVDPAKLPPETRERIRRA